MNWARTVALGVIGGALAAWLASASTSPARYVPPTATPRRAALEASGAALAAEVARLHDHLHPTAVPQEPTRNLFEFHAATPRAAAPIVPPAPAAQTADASALKSAAPALKLVGIADDRQPGAERTAIISGDDGQLFLVKAGDAVTARYKVARVADDSADLVDAAGATVRLTLK